MWLFLLFVVLPVIELVVIIQIGGAIGAWPTVGLLILSAMAGTWLMRRQGALAMADVQRAFRELRDPTAPLAHGALVLLAGALMIAPGFLSDIAGLLLLIPAVRRLVLRQLGGRIQVTRAGFGFQGTGFPSSGFPGSGFPGSGFPGTQGRRGPGPRPPGGSGPVIDADYVVLPDAPTPTGRKPSGWTRE